MPLPKGSGSQRIPVTDSPYPPCRRCNNLIRKGRMRQGLCNSCYTKGLLDGTVLTRAQIPATRSGRFRLIPGELSWDVTVEAEIMRELCRRDFWTFFLCAFGDGRSPKGQGWIDPEVHEPMAKWAQGHVEEWLKARQFSRGLQKHLALVVHREVGKSRMITAALQLWIHLRDPEISSYTGSESTELAQKILGIMRGVLDGSDPYAMWTILFGNWASSARQWTGKAITHAARKQTSRADPSLGTFAVETSIVGAHPDVIFYDDPISYERMTSDSNWLASVNSQVTSLFPVLQSDGMVVWVGCIAVGSPVLMADGSWKPIEQVQAGESVFTTDEHGASAVRTVEASLDQGEAETVTVSTTTGDLRCTPWHPFLTVVGGSLAWIRADALKSGDLVASVKRAPSDPWHPWMTERLAWLCGVILGDGWIGKNADYACIAMSKHEDLNERIISVLEDWIPSSTFHRTPFGYLRCNSRMAAEAFRFLELTGGAKTKRVPEWIFSETEANRVAFLRGFCEADGTKIARGDDGWRVEISNSELIRGLRLLAKTCGVRVGMEGCERERWIKAPNSRERVRSLSCSSHFNFATIDREERIKIKTVTRAMRDQVAAARKLGNNFRLDRVKSVKPSGRSQVWDLSVEGSRSFVCNGFVVHNTRYDDDDHFGVAFRNPDQGGEGVASLSGLDTDAIATHPEGVWHVYFLAGRDKEGKPTTPKVWPEERLNRYQRRDPLRYAAQVMNDPAISEFNPITKDQIKQCVIQSKDVPFSALRFGITIDIAFWDGESRAKKDDSVIVIHGYPRDGSGLVYVCEVYGSPLWRSEDMSNRLVSIVQRYRRMGRAVIGISSDKTGAGTRDSWRQSLQNSFHDVGERMPPYYEYVRQGTNKVQRMVAAASYWVDGYVKVVENAPGVQDLMDQMAKIGQYMINPRLKNDYADAHADAFQPEFYQPMRKVKPGGVPIERGARMIEVDGLDREMFDDSDTAEWLRDNPRPPLR